MVHVAKVLTLLICAVFAPAAGTANEVISFDGSWKEQGFLHLFSNDFGQRGRQLDIVSDGMVSLLWRPVEDGRSERKERAAHSSREQRTRPDLRVGRCAPYQCDIAQPLFAPVAQHSHAPF